MTDEDHRMTHHAAQRGTVLFTKNTTPLAVTLVAWKPHRNDGSGRRRNNQVRIEFPTGNRCTVHPKYIALPVEATT